MLISVALVILVFNFSLVLVVIFHLIQVLVAFTLDLVIVM